MDAGAAVEHDGPAMGCSLLCGSRGGECDCHNRSKKQVTSFPCHFHVSTLAYPSHVSAWRQAYVPYSVFSIPLFPIFSGTIAINDDPRAQFSFSYSYWQFLTLELP